MKKQIAIVGAGTAGLSAAYDLTRAGHDVVLYEAGAEVGGLAAGFRDNGWEWTLEKFYHHWFANDDAVLGLVEELGAKDRLLFPKPITSLWLDGKIHQMDHPNIIAANLRLPISWLAKLRYGLSGIFLKLSKNWKPLERHTADAWLQRFMGKEAYERLWRSLLIGKFGTHYDQVNMAWFWARVYKRTPRLGTFVGGFQAFLDLLAATIEQAGAEIRLNTRVESIRQTDDRRFEVTVGGTTATYDAVICTSSPMIMSRLVQDLPADYVDSLRSLKSMGAVVVVVALKHQLLTDGTYWLSLPADTPDKSSAEFPFLALVEHTNYMDKKHYGGDHLVYCGDYVGPDHEYFTLSDEELTDRFVGMLSRFNPQFSPDWVRKTWVFRAPYAQPIPFRNQSAALPDIRTPLTHLYLASMSQVYPWDRGTNYAVEMGRAVAHMALEDLAAHERTVGKA